MVPPFAPQEHVADSLITDTAITLAIFHDLDPRKVRVYPRVPRPRLRKNAGLFPRKHAVQLQDVLPWQSGVELISVAPPECWRDHGLSPDRFSHPSHHLCPFAHAK